MEGASRPAPANWLPISRCVEALGLFPSLGVSGPSLLQRPLSPLRAPARPHAASPPGPEEPRPTASPPPPALRGTGPPVLSPRSRQGMSPSQVQGSTQQPVWPAPKEPPVVPHGLEEQDPGGLCGGRTPARRLAAPGSPGPACLCRPAFLPPPPPSVLMGPGVTPGERACRQDGSGRGLCPLLRDRAGRLCGQASALFRPQGHMLSCLCPHLCVRLWAVMARPGPSC